MKKRKLIWVLLVIILSLPLWMWLGWVIVPKKKLVAAIIDKTVTTKTGQSHMSFTWVLNHERYTKTAKSLYNTSNDYYGFFPQEEENFRIKGLERFSPALLDKLSNDADMVYFTDTYGVYKDEWFKKNNTEGWGIIYGGMSEQDITLLNNMKSKGKLIITEFNTIGSPTKPEIRASFENMFSLKWTGWTGRYFSSLDTANDELPGWLIKNYKDQHTGQWPFHNAGIAFVKEDDQTILVLEEKTHLNTAMTYIKSNEYGQKELGLPRQTKYPFWFDIMQTNTTVNTIAAVFTLDVTDAGKAKLAKNNIPVSFPAITMHKGADYQFYYFSGDFCNNPISMGTSYFRGIRLFKSYFYKNNEPGERASFFWNFYQPLMTNIVNDYYRRISQN